MLAGAHRTEIVKIWVGCWLGAIRNPLEVIE